MTKRRCAAAAAAFLVLLVFVCANPRPVFAVTYTVTFEGNWNLRSAPKGVPSNAYFTTIIWATHSSGVTYWKPGGIATKGVEGVAEDGSTFVFADEVIAQRAHLGHSGTFSPPRGGEGTGSFKVRFSSKSYPLFTFLSMLGPTPDWFVDLTGVSLPDSGGNRVSSKNVSLYPWDSGTGEGSEYTQGNPATRPCAGLRRCRVSPDVPARE